MTDTVWTKACGSSSCIEVTEVIGLVRIRTAGAFDHVVPRP